MTETIIAGGLQLRFLQTKEDTGGSLDAFEMIVMPNARMPVPHYHETWDETIVGQMGVTTWRVDGKDIELAGREPVHQAWNGARIPQRHAGGGKLPLHSD